MPASEQKLDKEALVEVVDTHSTPATVHTHDRQKTTPFERFDELLAMEPPLVASHNDDMVYAMADYCTQTRRMLERVVQVLESTTAPQGGASLSLLSAVLKDQLRHRRGQWADHLRTYFYALTAPPPASGGVASRYSLAVQLWLLIAHANVILQQSNAVGDLFTFNPITSTYLSRNGLIVDDIPVMHYSLLSTLLALQRFTVALDTIDRMHADFVNYANALEHRLSDLVCHQGTTMEYNAPEWCIREPTTKLERLSEESIIYFVCWLTTIYNYADNWLQVDTVQVYDEVARVHNSRQIRVPAHRVANAPWMPSGRSFFRFQASMCQYASEKKDETYNAALRRFLLQFELKPHEVDLYRVLTKSNFAHLGTVMKYDFRGASVIARAYLQKVHYDRTPHSYIVELLQWTGSTAPATRSASLLRQGFVRELSVLFTIHQYIEGKFRLPFKELFLLFHRDPRFVVALESVRSKPYPVIIQQFRRFSVFVPHKRDPELDVQAVLHWRAAARAQRKNLPPLLTPPPAPPAGAHFASEVMQHARVYDCRSAMDAFAVWALWMLQLTDGRVDDDVSLRDFLLGMFGWSK